jgi:hypothetical protein
VVYVKVKFSTSTMYILKAGPLMFYFYHHSCSYTASTLHYTYNMSTRQYPCMTYTKKTRRQEIRLFNSVNSSNGEENQQIRMCRYIFIPGTPALGYKNQKQQKRSPRPSTRISTFLRITAPMQDRQVPTVHQPGADPQANSQPLTKDGDDTGVHWHARASRVGPAEVAGACPGGRALSDQDMHAQPGVIRGD